MRNNTNTILIYMAVLSALSTLVLQTRAHAGDWDWDDITAPYTQRLDTMTSSAGNAQRVNAVTHVITPWPRNVHNRHIPANGERMVGAIQRYQAGNKQRLPLARKEDKDSSFEMPLEPAVATAKKQHTSADTPGAGSGIASVSKLVNAAPTSQPSGASAPNSEEAEGEPSEQ
jgi:hypothetical protein